MIETSQNIDTIAFRKNTRLLSIISFLSDFNFQTPVWLFFYLRYLNYSQMGILFMIEQIFSNILEVPMGAFADLVGKRLSVFFSFLLYASAYLIQAFTTTFPVFIFLALMKGLSNALFSGSFEALVYDSFKQIGEEQKYQKFQSNSQFLYWIGICIASLIGGIIYDNWFQLPLLLTAGVYSCAAFLALQLDEPHIDSQKYSFKNYLAQNLTGIKELFSTEESKYISMILASLGAGFFIASNFLGISQARQYGLSGTQVGYLYATGFIGAACLSYVYPFIAQRFKNFQLLYFIGLVTIISFTMAKFLPSMIAMILIPVRMSVSAVFYIARSTMINPYISSKNRATSLSTLALISQTPYALGAYFIGVYIDRNSADDFAFLLGITLLILFAIVYLKSRSISHYFQKNMSAE